ncbi:MAG: ABC transporter permease [Candidatus Glassbacteria bacterium]
MRESLGRIREMLRKEFRQLFRDPRMVRILIFPPLFQLIVFGYAVSTDIHDTATFIVDHDGSLESRELVDVFTASGYFRVVGHSSKSADMVRALDYGDAIAGLVIPVDFSRSLQGNVQAAVQLILDGTNSNTALTARGYAEGIIQDYARRVGGVEIPVVIDLRERAWYNPELSSRNYNVPGVVAAIMMIICLLLTSLAVVREREIGTLEQLMVSPLKPVEFVAGKTIPFAIVGLFDLTLVTTLALVWFGVSFKGDFLFLFTAGLMYLLSILGVGLLISTVSKTQQEAAMASFLFLQPALLLSGFMFPISSMPRFFQYITLLNPLRHFLDIVRGVFLKGSGIGILWPQCLALLGIGIAVLAFAAVRFKKTIS